jgi:hypothetical protein
MHRARRAAGLLALTAAVAFASPARACPDCAAGQQARREVWRDDFAFYLSVAVLPFLLIGAVCARIEAMGRPRR